MPTDRLALLTGGFQEILDVDPSTPSVSISAAYSGGVLTATVEVDDVLTNPTTMKLQDSGSTFGIKRTDTDAVVVASGTAMTNSSTGVYTYTLTEPAANLTYFYSITAVISAVTYRATGYIVGADVTNLSVSMDAQLQTLCSAPLPLIHQQEKHFFQDFCLRTEVWLHEFATTTVADQAEYTFVLPTDTELIRIMSVEIDTIPQPFYVPLPSDTSLTFRYAPAVSTGDIVMRLVLAPKNERAYAPSWLLNRYGKGIADGVLGYLFGMGGRPWFDAGMAMLHMDRYNDAIARARGEQLDLRLPNARIILPTSTF